MEIEESLSKLTLCDEHGQNLTCRKKVKFLQFVKQLKSSGSARFIFRGLDNAHLKKQYNAGVDNISVLAQHVFLIGNKGDLFFKAHYKSQKQSNIFEFIWDILHDKVCKKDFKMSETNEHVSQFLKNNPEFKDYFSDEKNKDVFANKELSPEERSKVIDFYLALLHTIGKSARGDHSYFLSSSEDFSVANRFAGDGIVLYGWIPEKDVEKRIISYEDVTKVNEFVRSLGLPTYQESVYLEQKEICLKCGLLPHFIIGFQHGNRFYINPSTLKSWRDEMVCEGMDVDQTKFGQALSSIKNTKGEEAYRRYYIFCDGTYYLFDDGKFLPMDDMYNSEK